MYPERGIPTSPLGETIVGGNQRELPLRKLSISVKYSQTLIMEQQDLQQLNAEIKAESRFVEKIITGMGQTIVGQDHLVRALLIGLLADGHILLEGVPLRLRR